MGSFVVCTDIILTMIGSLTLIIILSSWTSAVPSFHTSSNNKTDIQAKDICVTVSGPSQGEPCVFPFIFTGKMFTNCTLWTFDTQAQEDKDRFWCSTSVDSNGEHVLGNYGFCDISCPGFNKNKKIKEKDKKDVLPAVKSDSFVFEEELPIILDYPLL